MNTCDRCGRFETFFEALENVDLTDSEREIPHAREFDGKMLCRDCRLELYGYMRGYKEAELTEGDKYAG